MEHDHWIIFQIIMLAVAFRLLLWFWPRSEPIVTDEASITKQTDVIECLVAGDDQCTCACKGDHYDTGFEVPDLPWE